MRTAAVETKQHLWYAHYAGAVLLARCVLTHGMVDVYDWPKRPVILPQNNIKWDIK